MPNINLTDSRQRDAVVKAENTGVDEEIRYVDNEGQSAYTRKILKATLDHDYDTLIKNYHDDPEKMALALVDSDPEVDMEKCGLFLWGVSKVYVDSEDGIVYRIEQTEIVRDPYGVIKEKRPRRRSESNVDSDIPLTWTGKMINKGEALRRFVFASKLQIVHVNGLTYDFLYGIAAELAQNDTLMMVGGGNKGRDPLIFRSGSIPYRGFLEGRIEGDKYILLLHLSNMELKLPVQKEESTAAESKSDKVAEQKSELAEKSVVDKKSKKVLSNNNNKKKKEEQNREKDKPDTDQKKNLSKTTKNKKTESSKKDKVKQGNTTKAKADKADAPDKKIDKSNDLITSEDLGVWLKSIRMGKYLKLFVENEIDVDVLPELSDADLKELDIPLGSRRRLLKAIDETEDLRAEVTRSVKRMADTAGGKG